MTRMQRRPLGTTLVHYPGKKLGKRLLTVIPAAALRVLGEHQPVHSAWTKAGEFYRVTPSKSKTLGSVPLYQPGTRMAVIDPAAASGMGLHDGDLLDWFVAAAPRDRWEIHAKRGGGTGAIPHTNGQGVPKGKMTQRPLARSVLRSHPRRPGCHFSFTRIPRNVMDILGASRPGHIKWEWGGPHYRIIPCGPEEPGACRVSNDRGSSNSASLVTYVRKPVADSIRARGHDILDWLVASDGKGYWEIRVGTS